VTKYPHVLVQCELEKHHVNAYAYFNLHNFTTPHAYITSLSDIPNLIKILYFSKQIIQCLESQTTNTPINYILILQKSGQQSTYYERIHINDQN
jgi:hypothetical protein